MQIAWKKTKQPAPSRSLLQSMTIAKISLHYVLKLKTNKSSGYDHFYVNVIWSIYHELKNPLMNTFSQTLSIGIFPDKIKIAKVWTMFKNA